LDVKQRSATVLHEMRVGKRLHGFGLAGDVIEMLVVDAVRRPVVRGH
jgi:hypothetical protein